MKHLRKSYNKLFRVKRSITGHHGKVYKMYIKEPSIKKLLKMGYESANRGYRYECRKKKSIHVLPTGEGWQVHVDIKSRGTHKVMKTKWAEVYINKYLERYNIL